MFKRASTVLLILLTLTASSSLVSAAAYQPKVSVLLVALDHPVGIAVDLKGDIFFTEYRGEGQGWLRVLWGNGTLHTLISNLQFPTGVSVDDHDNVYFGESSLGTVKKLELSSGNINVMVKNLTGVWGVGLDQNDNIYVTIRSVNGSLQKIQNGVSKVILGGLNVPSGIWVDSDGSVFFTEFGDNFASNGNLKKLDRDATEPTVLLSGLQNPYAVALDHDGNIYFTEKTGTLKKLPMDSSEPTTLLSGLGRVYGLSLDLKGNIFYVKYGSTIGHGDGSLEDFGSVNIPVQWNVDPAKTKIIDEEVKKVMQRVEDIRNLEFKNDIPVKILYRELIHRNTNLTEASEADWELAQKEYEALYILNDTYNLQDVTQSFLYANLLGYYEPEKDDIIIITSEKEVQIDDATLAHELTHAITDQYFPDIYLTTGNITDIYFAASSLYEGDAQAVESEYLAKVQSGLYNDSYHASSGSSSSGIPVGYAMIQIFPYIEGQNFVAYLRAHGGWNAVNDAYINPPTNTAQIIHPEKYFEGFKSENVTTQNLDVNEWQILGSDKLGEFSMFVMLWSKGVALSILTGAGGYSYSSSYTSGWDGDKITVYKKDGLYGYIWRTAWVNQSEASEFENGYLKMLGVMDAQQVGALWRLSTGKYIDIRRENSFVTIIGGSNLDVLSGIQNKTGILPITLTEYIPANTAFAGRSAFFPVSIINRSPTRDAVLIFQVKAETGEVVYLNYFNVTARSDGEVTYQVSWTPLSPGSYTIETYMWESLNRPAPLSPQSNVKINVSEAS